MVAIALQEFNLLMRFSKSSTLLWSSALSHTTNLQGTFATWMPEDLFVSSPTERQGHKRASESKRYIPFCDSVEQLYIFERSA